MTNLIKKVSLITTFLISFLCSIGFARAATVQKVPTEYYWHRVEEGSIHEASDTFNYYTIDGVDAYCLDITKKEGEYVELGSLDISGIPDDVKERVLLIAYYGYNYFNHQTLEYRAATQALIWETVQGPGNKVGFFTKLFGKGYELNIDEERNTIESLISEHDIFPSFVGNEYKVQLGGELTLTDSNYVLGRTFVSSHGLEMSGSGNEIEITPQNGEPGDYIVSFIKDNPYSKDYKIFIGNGYQNLIVPGSIPKKEASIKVTVYKTKIDILKHDSATDVAQGDATFKGATYKIYKQKSNEYVATVTLNEEGKGQISLPAGQFYMKETKAPTGYLLDNQIYEFDTTSKEHMHIDVYDEVIKGRISVNKYDFDTKSCTSKLVGAKYQISDKKQNIVDIITIDKNCSARSKLLPYGTYYIKEIEAPEGYLLDEQIYEYTISNMSTRSASAVLSLEKAITNKINIYKSYENIFSNFLTSEPGITFEIYNQDQKYTEITTDQNGQASITLPYGTWTLHQVNTTIGYEKIDDFTVIVSESSEKEQYFNIVDKQIAAYLKVIKIDSETKEPIVQKKTTFKILNVDTNEYVAQHLGEKDIDIFETDENGVMTTYLKIPYGHYKLIEISAPSGYKLGNPVDFMIENSELLIINYENEPIKGSLELLKDGEVFDFDTHLFTKKPLSNIRFRIYAAEDIYAGDNQTLYYSKGKLVDTLITDEMGFAKSKELPIGKYYIKETKTLQGYILDDEKYYFEVTNDNLNIKYEFTNILKKGKLEIIKKDETTEKPLKGATFDLYTENDTFMFSLTTDDDGKISFENLPLGSYYIVEKASPLNYMLSDEKIFFDITRDKQHLKQVVTNKALTGHVQILKVDSSNNPLANVKIGIYNEKDELCFEGITNEQGLIDTDLEYGTYYYKEIETVDGYILSEEKVYFNVDDTSANLEFTLVNNKITIDVPDTMKNKSSLGHAFYIIIYIINLLTIYEFKKS